MRQIYKTFVLFLLIFLLAHIIIGSGFKFIQALTIDQAKNLTEAEKIDRNYLQIIVSPSILANLAGSHAKGNLKYLTCKGNHSENF